MKRYLFYTRYAMRSFRRSGARAVFAIFCVAAGVAAIVALQLVSANLWASITGDAQKITRGDIAVTAPTSGMPVQDYNRADPPWADHRRHGCRSGGHGPLRLHPGLARGTGEAHRRTA